MIYSPQQRTAGVEYALRHYPIFECINDVFGDEDTFLIEPFDQIYTGPLIFITQSTYVQVYQKEYYNGKEAFVFSMTLSTVDLNTKVMIASSKKITDALCVLLYNYGFSVEACSIYVNDDGEVIENIKEYDKVGIMRRNTIKNIIEQ